jgi:ADP-ribosylglycohydrolase
LWLNFVTQVLHHIQVKLYPNYLVHVEGAYIARTDNEASLCMSDDTTLTLCLADSPTHDLSPNDIARNFINRYDEGAFTAHGTVFDTGIATSKAINCHKAGIAPEKAGCAGANENGNGSLMRIAPLVFYLTDKPEAERCNMTKTVSSITHTHPWSVAACYIYLEYPQKPLGGIKSGGFVINTQESA